MNEASEKNLVQLQLEEEKIKRQLKIGWGVIIAEIIAAILVSIWGYKNYKENKIFEAKMIGMGFVNEDIKEFNTDLDPNYKYTEEELRSIIKCDGRVSEYWIEQTVGKLEKLDTCLLQAFIKNNGTITIVSSLDFSKKYASEEMSTAYLHNYMVSNYDYEINGENTIASTYTYNNQFKIFIQENKINDSLYHEFGHVLDAYIAGIRNLDVEYVSQVGEVKALYENEEYSEEYSKVYDEYDMSNELEFFANSFRLYTNKRYKDYASQKELKKIIDGYIDELHHINN